MRIFKKIILTKLLDNGSLGKNYSKFMSLGDHHTG